MMMSEKLSRKTKFFGSAPVFPDRERFLWFEAHAQKIVARCRRVADAIAGFSDQPVPFYVPGGDDKYPSFWIRDFVMQCRSGFLPVDLLQTLLRLILIHQNGINRRDLANGLRVDPWAIADHINLPGVGNEEFQRKFGTGAVFYPGSYSPLDNQGNGRYGLRPPDDDIYEVVELARMIVKSLPECEAVALLQSRVGDVAIAERLHQGISAMRVHPKTGLCWNTSEDWAASNFHDGLKPMGFITLTSILRFRAACAMVEMSQLIGNRGWASHYERMAAQLASSVATHCGLPSGWLMVGTEVDRQPDVWSTAMAVYYGVLQGESRQAACEAMLNSYSNGNAARFGYLRHTPLSGDAKPGQQVWEDGMYTDYGVYQNGGYWPQPLGYYVFAMAQVDVEAARQMAREFIDHTRERAEIGAPFEWLNPDLAPYREEGKWYGPSATLPLEGFRRLGAKA